MDSGPVGRGKAGRVVKRAALTRAHTLWLGPNHRRDYLTQPGRPGVLVLEYLRRSTRTGVIWALGCHHVLNEVSHA
jgi:hypothetical protein